MSTPQSAEPEHQATLGNAQVMRNGEPWASVVHGVRVRGHQPLFPSFVAQRAWSQDWQVQYRDSVELAEHAAPPHAELIARQVWQGTTEYAFFRDGHCVQFVFPDFCRGLANYDTGVLELASKTATDAGLVLPNTVLSALLGPDSDVVLHASAVVQNDLALGICGTSGSGKSSLAATLSFAGWQVVSDDALRVVQHRDRVQCLPGLPELRLRQPHAWPLTGRQIRQLPDERTGYLPSFTHEPQALRALLFPVLASATHEPTLERVRGERCVQYLLCASRIAWVGTAGVSAFKRLAELGRQLPVYELHLPENYLHTPAAIDHLSRLLSTGLETSGV